jgi:signal-transduction protein with cAMP-binding, CBS, and nucleotidyltransferase domain
MQISSTALGGSRPAMTNLIERMAAQSNGLGLMGRLKLERRGSNRGLFRLIDHGLQPLSAALAALALIKKIGAAGNCEKINDLLRRGELDVDQAERMLAAWHSLHGMRLLREQSFQVGEHLNEAAFLNPDELTFEQMQSLKETLESVAVIQRQVEIIFSGMGE